VYLVCWLAITCTADFIFATAVFLASHIHCVCPNVESKKKVKMSAKYSGLVVNIYQVRLHISFMAGEQCPQNHKMLKFYAGIAGKSCMLLRQELANKKP
jgi:hypothetical protein